MNSRPGADLDSFLATAISIACVGASAIAAVALLGWQFGILAWTNVLPGNPAMNPLTAICILLAAGSLWLLRRKESEPQRKRFAQGCAALLAAIGMVRLFSIMCGNHLQLDQVVFRSELLASPVQARMGLYTTLGCICMGTGILSLDLRTGRGWNPADPLALAGAALSLAALVGYGYSAAPLHGLMAINTSAAFLFLSAAMLIARPDRGLCGLLVGASPGGVLARRVLPTAVFLPLILGWLRIQGQRAGLYGLEIGTSLLMLAIIGVLVWLISVTARRLDDADRERNRSDEALKRSR